ncbi:MAG: acyl-CoA/acyl-ACP dehydrogenase [Acidimicrobiales bacterium]|nr:acyl-CoA/acyl-ACP dehydrogenase [Acidimicrobiales bacterium]
MHFAPTEQQEQFASNIASILEKECSSEALQSAGETSSGCINGLWETLSETGLMGIAIPEKFGGLGMGSPDLIFILEEFGRSACSEPVAEHAAVAAPLIARWSQNEMTKEILEESATGSRKLTVGAPMDGRVVSVEKSDMILLSKENELHVVPTNEILHTPMTSIDPRYKTSVIEWSPSPQTLISENPDAIEDMINRGALSAAVQAVGVAQKLLDMTVSYVSERKQFGKPVGTNQAVKHHCSDMAIAVEFARPLVQVASWAIDNERSPTENFTVSGEVSAAKALASEAVELACRSALQCHGAIGYTVEHDLQIWLKRGWILASAWGDALFHRRRLGEILGLI